MKVNFNSFSKWIRRTYSPFVMPYFIAIKQIQMELLEKEVEEYLNG